MRWTIGMPSYNNMAEVWFTVQSLRLHHDLTDCEIVVMDNCGDDDLQDYIHQAGGDVVKYYRYTKVRGVSPAKNKIFDVARGDNVLIMDSHILLAPGALDQIPPRGDLVQGPLLQANCHSYWYDWKPIWGKYMWGQWGDIHKKVPEDPIEIWAMGAGFFACRRDSWLGFNKNFKGFGGETGYIQEKYRKAGRKVWCYPNMVWQHLFYNQGRKVPYPTDMDDRIRNYILGFEEVGLDIKQIEDHFGADLFSPVYEKLKAEQKEPELV